MLLDGRELSRPFQFQYLLIPQTHACVWAVAQAPKAPSIFDWDVREITHSLSWPGYRRIYSKEEGKPLPPDKLRGAMAQAITHSFGLIIGTYYNGDGKGVSFSGGGSLKKVEKRGKGEIPSPFTFW